MSDQRLQELYQRAVAGGTAIRGDHVPPERLQRLVEDGIAESEREALLDHVMSCPDCRRGYDLLTTLREAKPAPRRYLMPLALAATAVLAVGIMTRNRWIGEDPTRGGEVQPLTLAPAGDVPGPKATNFLWRPSPEAVQYRLELIDSQGEVVHSALTTDTSYGLPPSVPLAAGAEYQWVVTGETTTGRRTTSAVQRFRIRP